jgi:hypothetical protein
MLPLFLSIVIFPPGPCLHLEGVADAGQLTQEYRKEKTVSPLFVRGRPGLKILYDSGFPPKCNIPLLRTHLRSWDYVHRKQKKDLACHQRVSIRPDVGDQATKAIDDPVLILVGPRQVHWW